jgi:AcrR family transcriptional regulator
MAMSQARRVGTELSGSARAAIMNTAEELFAERGLDGVSLREINAVAGYSAAVLHYHFSTRDGLVRALLERAQPPIFAARAAAFEALAERSVVTPAEIVEALVRPLAVGMDVAPRESARRLRFLSRLYFDRSPYMDGMFEQSFGLFLPFLERALPELRGPTLRRRWELAAELAQHALGRVADLAIGQQGLGAPALESYLSNLMRFISGGLCAPSAPTVTSTRPRTA